MCLHELLWMAVDLLVRGEIRFMVRIAQVDGECATDCTVEDLRAIRAAGQAVHCVDIDLQMSSLASAARSPLYPPAGPRGPALPILAW